MYPKCDWWIHWEKNDPESTIYPRCSHWFPGHLAPSAICSSLVRTRAREDPDYRLQASCPRVVPLSRPSVCASYVSSPSRNLCSCLLPPSLPTVVDILGTFEDTSEFSIFLDALFYWVISFECLRFETLEDKFTAQRRLGRFQTK